MNPTITNLRRAVVSAIAVTTLAATCTPASAQPAEGIKVRGRWTIDVRNADGSLASHHEFDNALVQGSSISIGGNSALAAVLGKFVRHVASWQIQLTGNAQLCSEFNFVCVIDEHIGPGPAGLGELSIHVPTFSFFTIWPQGTVELTGMIQITNPGAIQRVDTALAFCRDEACTPNSQFRAAFTRHTLDELIPVAANQVVQVKVVLSFS